MCRKSNRKEMLIMAEEKKSTKYNFIKVVDQVNLLKNRLIFMYQAAYGWSASAPQTIVATKSKKYALNSHRLQNLSLFFGLGVRKRPRYPQYGSCWALQLYPHSHTHTHIHRLVVPASYAGFITVKTFYCQRCRSIGWAMLSFCFPQKWRKF